MYLMKKTHLYAQLIRSPKISNAYISIVILTEVMHFSSEYAKIRKISIAYINFSVHNKPSLYYIIL